MKARRLSIATMLLAIVLTAGPFSCIQHGSSLLALDEFCTENFRTTSAYEMHIEISIEQNSDFAELGFSGDGTESNPYVITGYEIHSRNACITISHTWVHFEVRNCYLTAEDRNAGTGINLVNVINGKVLDCVINQMSVGVYLDSCYNTSVSRCSISQQSYGGQSISGAIGSSHSQYCSISQNTIVDCQYGVNLDQSEFCTIERNTINTSEISHVRLSSGKNHTIDGNYLSGSCQEGLRLEWVRTCSIYNNTMIHCGVYMEGPSIYFWNHLESNNTVNGRPIGYFKEVSNTEITLDSYGQVFAYSCENLTFTDLNVSDTTTGFSAFLSPNVTLTEGIVDSVRHGIYLEICSYSTVCKSLFSNCAMNAIEISSSQYCHVNNNTIRYDPASYNPGNGVRLVGSDFTTAEFNTIEYCSNGLAVNSRPGMVLYNNTVSGSTCGALFLSGMGPVLFENNTIKDADQSGVILVLCENITVHRNQITNNGRDGVEMIAAVNCTISNNTITGNARIGISLENDECCPRVDSEDNSMFYNTVAWNHKSNALDNGNTNMWDDGKSAGNTWGDLNHTGYHYIPGVAGSVDRYPFKADRVLPILDSPNDITYTAGEEGNMIIWHGFDAHLGWFEIRQNGSVVGGGQWTQYVLNVSIDNLDRGNYLYNLTIFDTCANAMSDVVVVTVMPDTNVPEIDSPGNREFNQGTWGNEVSWVIYDANPLSYIILDNGTVIVSEKWTNDSYTVTLSLDYFHYGLHNLTLIISDQYENTAKDAIWITVNDITPPLIESLGIHAFNIDSSGYIILWNVSDANPDRYIILINNEINKTGKWNSSSESFGISIDGLAIGQYVYTLYVYDRAGNFAFDTVIVDVKPIESYSWPVDVASLALTLGSVAIIAIGFIAIFKNKGSNDFDLTYG
jgi:parallel beta-helix repeat protein